MTNICNSSTQPLDTYEIVNKGRAAGLVAMSIFGIVMLCFGIYLVATEVPQAAMLKPPTSTTMMPPSEMVGVIVGVLMVVAGAHSLKQALEYYNCRIIVDGEVISIRDWRRKTKRISFSDIVSVELRPFFFLTAKTSERFALLSADGDVLASLDRAMTNIDKLIASLDRRGVKLVKTDGDGPMLDSLTSFFGIDLTGTSLDPSSKEKDEDNR
ncbi:hypothetical protein [uncultured Olegusella sp.]|uniref:hypothetical protein n=1 Tax=uncultured Olegusella sp. TaxID=1979846 RepID=UPI00262FDA73|nr:hypothetical protein [uncultured Olegusella sp.]